MFQQKRPGKNPDLQNLIRSSASTSVAAEVFKLFRFGLSGLELISRSLARTAIGRQFEADLLAFNQIAHASPFDGADMDEDVLASVRSLDETIAFINIEPFHCASAHDELL